MSLPGMRTARLQTRGQFRGKRNHIARIEVTMVYELPRFLENKRSA